ncbi:MAG: ATP-binding cassette domain-containing protein [Polyangiaceae bacterium]|nr:ATP-binding cassette domain-containing protein [Polyangiaceae bacterium]
MRFLPQVDSAWEAPTGLAVGLAGCIHAARARLVLRRTTCERMLWPLVPAARAPIPAEIGAFARSVAPSLGALGLLGAVRWLTLPVAAYVIPTRVPVVVPLLVGALLEPVRLTVFVGLRRRLRRTCLVAFAEAALEAPGGEGTGTGAAWRAAYLTERAVAVDLPSVAAAALATIVLVGLSMQRFGWLPVGATTGVLALGAGLGWLASRQRRPLYARLVAAMRQVSAWMGAASQDRGEFRATRCREPFLDNVARASDEWSRAEARLERRRLVARVAVGCVVLAALGCAALAHVGSGEWLRLEHLAKLAMGRVADFIVLASLFPCVLLVARYADAWLGAAHELEELRPRAVKRTGADTPWRGRPERLRIEGLELRYGDALGVRVGELEVPLDGVLAVVGRNGSGKSTLASVIAGVLSPTKGRVELDGVASNELDRDQIAFVPQEPVVVDELTVAENVRMAAPAARDTEIGAMLARLGLTAPLGASARALSLGERRRIALGRGLLRRSRLLVLDEPDAWLDTEGRAQLLELLSEASEHAAVVLVTHRAEIADAAAQVIVLGDDQQPASVGPLERVRADCALYRRVIGGG